MAEHNIEMTIYAYNTNFAPHIVDKVVVEHILCIPSYPFWILLVQALDLPSPNTISESLFIIIIIT